MILSEEQRRVMLTPNRYLQFMTHSLMQGVHEPSDEWNSSESCVIDAQCRHAALAGSLYAQSGAGVDQNAGAVASA